MPRNLIPILCNYDGEFKIEAEKVCYRGGITRLIYVDQSINMANLQLKLKKTCSSLPNIAAIKYRNPDMGCYLQLVAVKNDEDLTKMKNIFFLRSNSVPIQLYISAAEIHCSSACSTNNSRMTRSDGQSSRKKAESKDCGPNKTPKIGCKECRIDYGEEGAPCLLLFIACKSSPASSKEFNVTTTKGRKVRPASYVDGAVHHRRAISEMCAGFDHAPERRRNRKWIDRTRINSLVPRAEEPRSL